MPYVDSKLRDEIDQDIKDLRTAIINLSDERTIEGNMNYCITSLLEAIPLSNHSVDDLGDPKWRYKYINRAIGVLECVKLEFYRRLAGPYEDGAKNLNGDLDIYD